MAGEFIGKKASEITVSMLLPYMRPEAQRAVADLAETQNVAVDDLDLDAVIERANEYRAQAGLVAPTAGCPECGEDRIDVLVWQEDGERVRCDTCGEVYKP